MDKSAEGKEDLVLLENPRDTMIPVSITFSGSGNSTQFLFGKAHSHSQCLAGAMQKETVFFQRDRMQAWHHLCQHLDQDRGQQGKDDREGDPNL